MTDAPERIWAEQTDTADQNWRTHNRFGGVEYRRADIPPTLADALAVPEVQAMRVWAIDAQQALIDAMEEIIELRLTLGKSDLEPPWLTDAIDQSRAVLAALTGDGGDK